MKTTGENSKLQERMNARLWQCVLDYGGAQDFSRLTSISPQTLYNIRDNRSFPSTPTIKVFTRFVANLSLPALYADTDSVEWRSGQVAQVAPITSPTHLASAMESDAVARLLAIIEEQRIEIKELKTDNRTYVQDLREMLKSNFPESDSRLTALASYPSMRMEVAGFGREPKSCFADYIKASLDMMLENKLAPASVVNAIKTRTLQMVNRNGTWQVPATLTLRPLQRN